MALDLTIGNVAKTLSNAGIQAPATTTVAPPPKTPAPGPVYGPPAPTVAPPTTVAPKPPPTQPSPQIVASAKPAITSLNNTKTAIDQINNSVATQANNVAANTAATSAQNQQTQTDQANADALKAAADAVSGTTTDNEPKLTPGETQTGITYADISKQLDDATAAFNAAISQFQNGTFPLTPAEQAVLNSTQKTYQDMITQQQSANNAFIASAKMTNVRLGLNVYAPTEAMNNIQTAVNQGLKQINTIEAESAKTLADLNKSFEDSDYQRINDLYKTLTDSLTKKTDIINNINTQVSQQADEALKAHQQQMDDLKAEQDKQQAAIKFATDNNVTKPFYLVGNTAINTATGEPVTLAEYQKLTGQQVGLPEDQTDFSQIQHIADPQVTDLATKYPDAGIQATDTLAQAQAKLKNSSIYRKATYIAPTGISGLNSGVSTVGGSNIVAGVKVPAAIAGDVEDVLSGRNTLYNIRQTMGRTNAAAAYMQQMRDAIRSIDPNFDFVASDAGGKFVSSTYYQKAASAINSVLPNIDKVVELSDQVDRVGVAAVDKLLQSGAVQIGNTKVANFKEAQKLIADEIGVALGAGTVSDMKLQLGFDVTDPSVSPEVFASNMDIVRSFINNRLQGLNEQRYSSSVDLTGGSSNSSAGSTIEYNGQQYNVDADGNLTPVQ